MRTLGALQDALDASQQLRAERTILARYCAAIFSRNEAHHQAIEASWPERRAARELVERLRKDGDL